MNGNADHHGWNEGEKDHHKEHGEEPRSRDRPEFDEDRMEGDRRDVADAKQRFAGERQYDEEVGGNGEILRRGLTSLFEKRLGVRGLMAANECNSQENEENEDVEQREYVHQRQTTRGETLPVDGQDDRCAQTHERDQGDDDRRKIGLCNDFVRNEDQGERGRMIASTQMPVAGGVFRVETAGVIPSMQVPEDARVPAE